ncbi:MAG: adventurous gliding motility protein GltG [Pseudomonadota bacterium]
MGRLVWLHGLGWLLIATACAAGMAPGQGAAGAKRVELSAAPACSSQSRAGIGAAMELRLERASNLLEYENTWRAEHPDTPTGSVSGAEVRMRIQANKAQLQACYEAAWQDLPDDGGRVVVRFVIEPDGQVATVHVAANELGVPQVGCCVAKRIAQWSFTGLTQGGFVVVEYPFVVRVAKSH